MALVVAALVATPVSAAVVPGVDVPAGPLSAALTALGRQANIDILFSDRVIGDRQCAALRGEVAPGDALARLLAGSGLTYRRTAEGAYIIEQAAVAPTEFEEAIPEILVIGRRVQNSDIRRTQDDIQPYQVYSRHDVQRARSSSIEAFARSRLPANAQIASPRQTGSNTRSEINLRGLGANQTLILVDGRRMPNLPSPPFSFNQPDVNGIPVEMIDRIEVLTATAGGVYGTGATSGAVNIVLQNDFRGAEVSATTGVSSRGDAFEYRLFGRVGFTPDNGRTNVMLAASWAREAILQAGERDYLDRAARRRFANDPETVLGASPFPTGNGINIIGTEPLTLDPEFGGTALGARFTTLPLGLGADVATRNALLVANAGTLTLDQAPGVRGTGASVQGSPEVRSILLNVRHDFGGGVEAAVDLIDTRNRGRRRSASYSSSIYPIPASQPNNPFQQTVFLAIPADPLGVALERTINDTQRLTASLTVPLPGRWRANAEIGRGHARAATLATVTGETDDLFLALYRDVTPAGKPVLRPLGDWDEFTTAIGSYAKARATTSGQSDRFRNLALRLAGPVLQLAGGPAALTLLAENRRETIAESQTLLFFSDEPIVFNLPRVARKVQSLYGEGRLPLTADAGLFSRLELQLALRHDWTRTTLPGAVTFFETDPPPYAKRNSTTMYTAGFRVAPMPGLLLRASTATGALPPATDQIGARQSTGSNSTPDPQRGGRFLGREVTTTFVTGGRSDLRPERARSISAGAIVSLGDGASPRLSVDFTRITKRDEIVPLLGGNEALLLANEAIYPDRITRAPLSDADRVLGFTAGPVTRIDLSSINLGRTRIDAVDVAFDHSFSAPAGDFNAYLRATWEPTFTQQAGPGALAIERVGYVDGPLEWRGNAGLDWSRGRFTVGCNGQFYSRYRVVRSVTTATEAQTIKAQGALHIPAQFYVDLYGTYRLGPNDAASGPELRWGLSNVFDRRPPTVVDPNGPGYSFYGDPRRRRFQLTLDVPLAGR
ncbi:TonB-dependent receptor [Glacieibacterium frigidum]|uniref:TonB-dependent receptor n=1 Tax=Glacieibacterium frigidum TaxID=2593303 RepID=UPI00163D634F|nr:TonB-dependent receptor [Glacieibacterium frigidum]